MLNCNLSVIHKNLLWNIFVLIFVGSPSILQDIPYGITKAIGGGGAGNFV